MTSKKCFLTVNLVTFSQPLCTISTTTCVMSAGLYADEAFTNMFPTSSEIRTEQAPNPEHLQMLDIQEQENACTVSAAGPDERV